MAQILDPEGMVSDLGLGDFNVPNLVAVLGMGLVGSLTVRFRLHVLRVKRKEQAKRDFAKALRGLGRGIEGVTIPGKNGEEKESREFIGLGKDNSSAAQRLRAKAEQAPGAGVYDNLAIAYAYLKAFKRDTQALDSALDNGTADQPAGANLEGTFLYGAHLSGANLEGARLYGADLSGAIMPDGTIHE